MTTRNDAETATQDRRQKTRQMRTPFVMKMLLTLLFMVMIASILYSLHTNLQLNEQMQTLTTEAIALKQQQLDTKAAFNSTLDALHAKQVKTNLKLSALDKNLSSALQERWFQNNDWLLLKARYYLEIAHLNENWSDNNETTVALLQQADSLLATIHDSHVFVVRQAIAQEIAQQQAIPTVDIAGLLAKLNAIEHQLGDLPIKNPFSLTKNMAKEVSNNASSSTWHEHLENSLHLIEKLVVIRHNNETVEPLLAPEHQSILLETIRLNLQETQWAVLQRNQAVYELFLTQILEKMNQGFDLNAASTQTLKKEIQDLQKTSLNAKKTSQEESLILLNQLIEANKNSPALLPAEPTDTIKTPTAGEHS